MVRFAEAESSYVEREDGETTGRQRQSNSSSSEDRLKMPDLNTLLKGNNLDL